MLEYHAAYYKDSASGWYTVQLLDFPAVISQGKTLRSAREMIKDALREMAQWYVEDGQALPRPKARAADKNAEVIEPVRLQFRVLAGDAK